MNESATYDSFLTAARGLALEAGVRVMDLLKDPLVKTRKADKSIVTNADHAANDILRRGLRKSFPDHAVLSEETGLEGPESPEYVWLVDPLDGTRAYARGEAGFSVMVGLLRRGKPVLGVVFDPWEGHLYEAARGLGSFHSIRSSERKPVRVSSRREWSETPLIASTGFSIPLAGRFRKELNVSFLPPINSVGIKVGYLVRKEADIYVNHHPVHYWDTCAPLVVLEEAGGVMTLWDGTLLVYFLDGKYVHPGPTLATNGTRHEDLIHFLAAEKK